MTSPPRTIGSLAGDGALNAPERGADAGQQFLGTERLCHVVVGARIERAHLVAFGPPR